MNYRSLKTAFIVKGHYDLAAEIEKVEAYRKADRPFDDSSLEGIEATKPDIDREMLSVLDFIPIKLSKAKKKRGKK